MCNEGDAFFIGNPVGNTCHGFGSYDRTMCDTWLICSEINLY